LAMGEGTTVRQESQDEMRFRFSTLGSSNWVLRFASLDR
jgi:hypothetical protein